MQSILKRLPVIICISFLLIIFTFNQAAAVEKAESENIEIRKSARHLVVTYFHTAFRCPTCHKIEKLSTKTVKTYFENELKTGKLVWRVINVDESKNEHYIQDYHLYSKHLIVSEVKDGKEVRWKDLNGIWTFFRDDQKFKNYVKTEIADWLKE